MAGENEFDVEALEGEDGELGVAAAPPPPASPAAIAKPPPSISPEEEQRRKGGRPRKVVPISPPISGALGPPALDISQRSDEWPKDARGMWLHILDHWAKQEGRTADDFIIYVHRMMGPTVQPIRMGEPIYGSQVAGSEEINAGDALIAWLTDVFHMNTANAAANYRLEFCWRATGAKIRMSEPWVLDSPMMIEKLRRRTTVAAQRLGGEMMADGSDGRLFGMRPRQPPAWYPPAPIPAWQQQPMPQQPQAPAQPLTQAAAAAPPPQPQPPPPPPTGDPWVDRYVSDIRAQLAESRMQFEQERLQREEDRRTREEERRRHEAELRAALPPPPAPPAPESEDAKQARLAASIAQAVMQTLIAAGVVNPNAPPPVAAAPPPPPPPVITPAQSVAAVSQQATSTSALENLIQEVERIDKLKGRMRRVLGVPEEEEDDPPPPEVAAVVVPEEPAEKPLKTYKMGGFTIPRFDDADEVSLVTKAVAFFGANPALSKELAGQVMGAIMSKVSPGMLQQVLGAAMAQGGGVGAAAAGIHAATAGAAANGASRMPP